VTGPVDGPPTQGERSDTSKNVGSLIGGAAVVAAAIGLTAGLAPASAAPQQSPGSVLSYLRVTPSGLQLYREIYVPTDQLNEDDGTDKVYVRVRFVPGNGAGGDLRANTNAISGQFGMPLAW
jgi:hypothetical protein